ncbi:porin family protein [Mucilaginibacter agri]|uniref:Outer membrane beta-barrel protein n=1 Tax=Mucilaginibacter agri TaxID=2695265 RepID=A0A965ZH02_9SPHI|nr:porin family protein [Mucilaginibacter agri]NCD69824.1 outer membrane beta-barrel protein [Mucilaginibacter agri]
MKYILVCLFSILTINCYGQKFSWGVKAGGGIADQGINNKDIISVNSIITLNFAGIVRYSLPHQFDIQTTLGINNRGAEIIEDGITTTPKITYLDLPVNLIKKFNFPGLGMIYLGGGPYAAYALSGKYKFETPNSVSSEKLEFGKDKDVQRYDAGLNFTTGLELNNHLLFDIRYALGLKNIASQPSLDTGTSSIKNRLLTVSLGYLFE